MSDRLSEIEERLAAATPGPWYRHDFDDAVTQFGIVTHAEVWNAAELDAQMADVVTESVTDADAELIAHAPADLAALVKFAREVRSELDQPHPTTAVIAQALDALEAS